MNKTRIITAIMVLSSVGAAWGQGASDTSIEQAREQVLATAKSEGFGEWFADWTPKLLPFIDELDKQCEPIAYDQFYAFLHLNKDGIAGEVILDSKEPPVKNQFEDGRSADALASYRRCFIRVAKEFKYPDIPRDDFWITVAWESVPEGSKNDPATD